MTYRFFFILFRILSFLPFGVLYLFSDIVSPFVRHVLRYRRKVLRQNLATSFPEKTDKERMRIERDYYRLLCDYFVENLKLFSISPEKMMKRMTFGGLESAKEGFESGKDFMFVYLGHYGNWEWIASLQYWMPHAHCTQIYHPLYNKVADKMFLHLRQQYGGECIPMKKTLRRLVELKREGRKTVVGFISDQLPKWNSIHHFTSFLNHDTAVFTGTEQMAKKFGAMVYYGRVTRPRRGYYHCEMIPMTDNPSLFEDFKLTDLYMQMLEEDIRRIPSLWLWTHKRWRRTKEEWLRRNSATELQQQPS